MAGLTGSRRTCVVAVIVLCALAMGSLAQQQPADAIDTNRLALARELMGIHDDDMMEDALERLNEKDVPTRAAEIVGRYLDEEVPRLNEQFARAAAKEFTADELRQFIHMGRSDTIRRLTKRWKAIQPVFEALREASASRFLGEYVEGPGPADRPHGGCKLCMASKRGPLDSWAIHWLDGRPVSPGKGTQPELKPLYAAFTAPNAGAAETNAYLRTLREEARGGDEDSALALGCLRWLAEDFDEATNWLTRAAHLDSHGAQFLLGHALFEGWGVDKDAEAGLTFLRAAAAQDLPQAQYKLGEVYLEPEGAFADKQKGIQWMKRAADSGVPQANRYLGNYLLTQPLTPARKALVEKYLARAAMAGSTKACDDLVAYHMTWGNSDKAVRWLRKRINRGDLGAYNTLAVKYLNTGKTAEAFRWWTKGAERGHRKSQLEAARMVAAGRGCERDVVAAEKWLIVAGADKSEREHAYEDVEPPSPGEVLEARTLAEAYWEKSKGRGADSGR